MKRFAFIALMLALAFVVDCAVASAEEPSNTVRINPISGVAEDVFLDEAGTPPLPLAEEYYQQILAGLKASERKLTFRIRIIVVPVWRETKPKPAAAPQARINPLAETFFLPPAEDKPSRLLLKLLPSVIEPNDWRYTILDPSDPEEPLLMTGWKVFGWW